MALIAAMGSEAAGLMAVLHGVAFPPGQAWSEAAIAAMLRMPGAFGLMAAEAEQPLGFALGRCIAGEAEVLTLAVLPAMRRRGLGRALLDALAAEASRRGAAALFLEVSAGNAAAQALYAGAGAVEVGRRRRYYSDGSDALVMRLPLPG